MQCISRPVSLTGVAVYRWWCGQGVLLQHCTTSPDESSQLVLICFPDYDRATAQYSTVPHSACIKTSHEIHHHRHLFALCSLFMASVRGSYRHCSRTELYQVLYHCTNAGCSLDTVVLFSSGFTRGEPPLRLQVAAK